MSQAEEPDRRNSEPSDNYRPPDDRESYHSRGRGRGRNPRSTYRGSFPRGRGNWFDRGRGRGERGAYRGRGEGRGNYRGNGDGYRERGGGSRGRGYYNKEDYGHEKRDYHNRNRYEDTYHHKESHVRDRDYQHKQRRSHSKEREYPRERSDSLERSRGHRKHSRDGSPVRESHQRNSIEREYKRIINRDRSRDRTPSWGRNQSHSKFRSRSRERNRSQNSSWSRERSPRRGQSEESSPSQNSRSGSSKLSRGRSRSHSYEQEHGRSRRRRPSHSFSRSPSDRPNSQASYRVSLQQEEGLYGTDQETSDIIKDTFSDLAKTKSKKKHVTATRSRSSSNGSTDDDPRLSKGSFRTSSFAEHRDPRERELKFNTRFANKPEGLSDIFRDKNRLDELAKDISIKISVANPEAKIREETRSQEKYHRSSTKSSRQTEKETEKSEQKSSLFGALPDLFHTTKPTEGEHRSRSGGDIPQKDSFQKEKLSTIPGLDSVNDVDDEEEFLYGDLLPKKPVVHTEQKEEKHRVLKGSSEMEWETNEPLKTSSRIYAVKEEMYPARKPMEAAEGMHKPVRHKAPPDEPVYQTVQHQHHAISQQYQQEPAVASQPLSYQHVTSSGQLERPDMSRGSASTAAIHSVLPAHHPVSSAGIHSSVSSDAAEVKNLGAIQQANLLSTIHQPGFMDAVNRGRSGKRITESDLLAAANYQKPSISISGQQYGPALPGASTQLQIKEVLSSERRLEPEKPVKPEPSKDKTLESILKSIGFNVELSKIMQDKNEKEKQGDAGMKQSVDSFGIKEGSSFLQGGLRNVDIQSVFDNKEAAKGLQKGGPIQEESYEEQARRYMEEQKRASTGWVNPEVTQSTKYGENTYSTSTALHGVDHLRQAYEEKEEPSSYEQYTYETYDYGDQHDYESRQFMEMQQHPAAVSNIAVVGHSATVPLTKPAVGSHQSEAMHTYYHKEPSDSTGADTNYQNKVYTKETPKTESRKHIHKEEKDYRSYHDPERKTSVRSGSPETYSYRQQKADYSREHSLEKIEAKESRDQSQRVVSRSKRSPSGELRGRYSVEKPIPDHLDRAENFERRGKFKPVEKDKRGMVSGKGRYRDMDKESGGRKEAWEYPESPERHAKKPRLEKELPSTIDSMDRQLLEANIPDVGREELPHQRRVVIMKTREQEEADDLLSSSRQHRQTVAAQNREPAAERMSREQHARLKREMTERKKKLVNLEKELEYLSKEQQDLKQRSQRDGHRDKMMGENSKLQADISKQIAYLRRALDDNMKRLNSVEVDSPEREATPKHKAKEEPTIQELPRSRAKSKPREKSPEVEETRKIFVDKKRKLESQPKPVAPPEKQEQSPRSESSSGRKPKTEFDDRKGNYEREGRDKYEKESREKYEREAKEKYERDDKEKYEKEDREKYERDDKEKFKKVLPSAKRVLRTQPKEVKPKFENKYVNKRFQLYFDYFDRGDHWCSSCHYTAPSIGAYLDHIESKKHLKRADSYLKPWAKSFPEKKVPYGITPVRAPFRGVEFLSSCQSFYCSLCNVFSGDQMYALQHLKSDAHNENYKTHCEENPGHEKKLKLDRTAGQTIKKDLKSKKDSKKSKHKKKSKESPEKETSVKKIQFKLGKAKTLMPPKDKDPSSSSSSSSGSSSSSSSTDSSSDSEAAPASGFKKLPAAKKVRPDKSKSETKISSSAQSEASADTKKQPFKFPLVARTLATKGAKINVKMASGTEAKYKPKDDIPPKKIPIEPEVIVRKKPSRFSDKEEPAKKAEDKAATHKDSNPLNLFVQMQNTVKEKKKTAQKTKTITGEDNKTLELFYQMQNQEGAAKKTSEPTTTDSKITPEQDNKIPEVFLKMRDAVTGSVSFPVVKAPPPPPPPPPVSVPEKKQTAHPPVLYRNAVVNAFTPSKQAETVEECKRPESAEDRKQREEMEMLGLDPADSTLSVLSTAVPPPVVLPRKEGHTKERKSFMASSNAAKLYNIFYGSEDKQEKPVSHKLPDSSGLGSIPMPPMKQWQIPKPKPPQAETAETPAVATSSNVGGSKTGPKDTITEGGMLIPLPPVNVAQSGVINNQENISTASFKSIPLQINSAPPVTISFSSQEALVNPPSIPINTISNMGIKTQPSFSVNLSEAESKVEGKDTIEKIDIPLGAGSSDVPVVDEVVSDKPDVCTEVPSVPKIAPSGPPSHAMTNLMAGTDQAGSSDCVQPNTGEACSSFNVFDIPIPTHMEADTDCPGDSHSEASEARDSSNKSTVSEGSHESKISAESNLEPQATSFSNVVFSEKLPKENEEETSSCNKSELNVAKSSAGEMVITGECSMEVTESKNADVPEIGSNIDQAEVSDSKEMMKPGEATNNVSKTVENMGQNQSENMTTQITDLGQKAFVQPQVGVKKDYDDSKMDVSETNSEAQTSASVSSSLFPSVILRKNDDTIDLCLDRENEVSVESKQLEQVQSTGLIDSLIESGETKSTEEPIMDVTKADSDSLLQFQSSVLPGTPVTPVQSNEAQAAGEMASSEAGEAEQQQCASNEGEIDTSTPDSTVKSDAQPDDGNDFLQISPKRGSGRGRMRGKRGRGRGRGRGAKYRARNRKDSTASDEDDNKKQEAEQKTDGVGETQSGGKWKALESVNVTSTQAVTLQDIAQQQASGAKPGGGQTEETIPGFNQPEESEQNSDGQNEDTLPGFELIDECSEN